MALLRAHVLTTGHIAKRLYLLQILLLHRNGVTCDSVMVIPTRVAQSYGDVTTAGDHVVWFGNGLRVLLRAHDTLFHFHLTWLLLFLLRTSISLIFLQLLLLRIILIHLHLHLRNLMILSLIPLTTFQLGVNLLSQLVHFSNI